MPEELYAVPEQYRPNSARYTGAHLRKCGRSGIRMSALSLGFWQNFGGMEPYENGRAIARAAFDAGVTCFDLANNYGPPYGSAEENFGRMMRDDFAPHRPEMFIASKAGYDMWPGPYGQGGSRKYLLASLDASLKRMNLDYVDVFYHHCMDPETPLEETMSALVQAVRSGKAMYVGLSNYSPEQMQKALALLQADGVPCLVEQSAYNMLNRAPQDSGLLDLLAKNGVGFAAFSPLAQGMLSGKYNNGIPAGSRAAGYSKFLRPEQLTDDVLTKISALGKIAEQRGQAMAQFALSWLLQDQRVTTVIIGASKVSQLEQNLAAAQNASFTAAETQEIEAILAGSGANG